MSNEITKHPDLIKKEAIIKDLQGQLKRKNTTLKALKTRLKNTQQEVEEISRNVENSIMRKLDILDELRIEIADLANQLKKSKNISREDKIALKEMAEDLSDSENLMGPDYAGYKENREKMERGEFDFDENQKAKMRDIFAQFQAKPSDEEQRDIRKIFLKLSQKFHPDLAKNKKEETDFHILMQEINEAYQNNDIHSLLEMERMYLMEEFDFTGKTITIDVLDQEIKRLKKSLQFINNQINRTSEEIKNFRQSDMGNFLTNANKADREGVGMDQATAEMDQMIEMLTQLRDALKESVEIDGLSPKIIQLIMGNTTDDSSSNDLLEDIMGEVMRKGTMPTEEDAREIIEKIIRQNHQSTFGNKSNAVFFDSFMNDFDEEDEYEPIKNPKFPIGSSVSINGKAMPLPGAKVKKTKWQGRVKLAYYDDYGKKIYQIALDSISLKELPRNYIMGQFLFSEEFDIVEIQEKDLTAAQPRDSIKESTFTSRQIFHANVWYDTDKKQAERIKNIMMQTPDQDDIYNWMAYFEQELQFPIEAVTSDDLIFSGFPEGLKCTILAINHVDEEDKIIAEVRFNKKRKPVLHPLYNLRPVGKNGKVREIFEDYSEWYMVVD